MGQSEEIKSKLDIVEVIREYVPVKAVGANFQALCPFHNEKTPSFIISPDKQIWHCFGCGRGGDVFSFVMEKEGLNFSEVLRHLAPKAGVVLKHENAAAYSRRNRLLDVLELAGKYYARLLEKSVGEAARAYLIGRGLSEETLREWKLGYSPAAWDELYKFLLTRPLIGKKFTDEEIFLAGLTVRKEGGRGYYDRFRDRIMFPIFDGSNNLIAFTARVNPAKEATEKMGKYINSPETPVYEKSRVLFGLSRAKTSLRREDQALIMEGQMDVITSHQHGFTNAVASSGTALTADQLKLIKRFTNNLALCFDMDEAGQIAADRGIREALRQEMNVKVVVLPEGKDPDESLRKNPDDLKNAVAEAKPVMEYYLQKISAGLDLELLDNKQAVAKKALALLKDVNNRLEREFWLHKLSESLSVSETVLRESLEKLLAPGGVIKSGETAGSGSTGIPEAAQLTREERLGELFLALLVRYPEFIPYSVSHLEPDFMAAPEQARFYNHLIIYYNKFASLVYEDFRIYLEEQGASDEKLLDKLALLGEKDFYNFTSPEAQAEIIKIMAELKKFGCQKRLRKLQKAIASAEEGGRNEELQTLMAEIKNLTDQLNEINLP